MYILYNLVYVFFFSFSVTQSQCYVVKSGVMSNTHVAEVIVLLCEILSYLISYAISVSKCRSFL